MTVKEWVKEYPTIAASLFKCSVDDLDNILEENHVDTNGDCYLTKADVDRIVEALIK